MNSERGVLYVIEEFRYETRPGKLESIVIGKYTPKDSELTRWRVCGEEKTYVRAVHTKKYKPYMTDEGIAKELKLAFECKIKLGVK